MFVVNTFDGIGLSVKVQVFAKKGFGFFQHLNLCALVAKAMSLVFEQANIHCDAIGFKRSGHPFGLFRRHHFVLQALKEQHWTANSIGVLKR